jgi:hypothetical protein
LKIKVSVKHRKHNRLNLKFCFYVSVEYFSVMIFGDGFFAELCDDLIAGFKTAIMNISADLTLCLPHAYKPDVADYAHVVFLILLAFVLLILEPFGLRLRNIILEYFYPERSKERTIWLYHNILRKRTSYLKFAKRELKKKLINEENFTEGEEMNCFELFRAKVDR